MRAAQPFYIEFFAIKRTVCRKMLAVYCIFPGPIFSIIVVDFTPFFQISSETLQVLYSCIKDSVSFTSSLSAELSHSSFSLLIQQVHIDFRSLQKHLILFPHPTQSIETLTLKYELKFGSFSCFATSFLFFRFFPSIE